ncbi:MAG: Capsular polysaccharide transport system permease protein [Hydrocarboniphaga sp.]|uniref:hypothetical protein n=1 Tax=Hydrocarboniphaga sp. TaxID=2033016 RepID=UPI00262D202D|nr:hypothetical protein [Hydrocarboniphaga sp.]MDB5972038.1 Capsular polysaccharide transport system permease protein [Hydrocarboniphaga sp.]
MINEALGLEPPATRRQKALSWLRTNRGWLIGVALPTLIAAFYYLVIASDLYASEARFVVRSPSHAAVSSGIAGLLQSGGIGSGQGDVYTVQDFATSRDAVAALSRHVDLRALFGRKDADFVARYPNLLDDSSEEDLHRYFQRRVQLIYDTTTGISTLTAKAFRPDDAQTLARLVLDESEALVNRLNERSRVNAVHDAEEQLQIAQGQTAEAESELLAYRNRESLLNPGEASTAMFKNLSALQGELSAARVRLSEIEHRAPDSPMRSELQERIGALQRQIADERAHLAGKGGSMAPKLSEYRLLELRQEFTSKQLASTLASLEAARAEARRQQIYLDRVVEPSLPDKALYPQRGRDVLIVLISCFLVYSIGSLLIAGVREHAQS